MTDGPPREFPRNVWILSGTILFNLTALYSWNRIIALYLRHLGAGEEEISLSFFFYALAYRSPQVVGGLLADRLGRKAIVVLGTFGMAAGFAAVMAAPRWGLVVAAICFSWAIGAVQWPALVSLVADSVAESRRGRAMGALEACSMAGMTLGPLVGGWVDLTAGDLAATWRILLAGTLAVYALCGLIRLAFLREVASRTEFAPAPVRVPWALLAVPLLVSVLTHATWFLTTDGPIMALYIVDVTGGTSATVQSVGFYGGLSAVAGAIVSGWVADRIGAGRTMALGAVLTLAVVFPLALGVFSPGLEKALFALSFLPGETFLVAYNKLVTSSMPPKGRGLAVGLVGTAVGLASSWAMMLGGHLYAMDRRGPLVAAAGCQGAASLLGLALLRRRHNGRP